jgi:hypothetical protein
MFYSFFNRRNLDLGDVMIYSKFDHEDKRWFTRNQAEHYRLSKTFAIG